MEGEAVHGDLGFGGGARSTVQAACWEYRRSGRRRSLAWYEHAAANYHCKFVKRILSVAMENLVPYGVRRVDRSGDAPQR